MAKKINAIGAYRPRIELGNTVQLTELVKFVGTRTGANRSEVNHITNEVCDGIVHYNLQGRSVKVPGIGTFTPKIALSGKISVSFRPDMELKERLNAPKAFTGTIINRDMSGKTSDQLVELWNEEHPDDPVV